MPQSLDRRAVELLDQALDLPSECVSDFLSQHCGDDDLLRQKIESLMAAMGNTNELLPNLPIDTPTVQPSDQLDTNDASVSDSASNENRLSVGQELLNRYQIVSVLGSGGMGEVYRARDLRLDRDVAIKLVNVKGSGLHSMAERFRREIRSVASLSHPNVMTLYDFCESEDLVFAVMELVEGKTLRSLMGKSLDQDEVLVIAQGIAEGLGAAHAKGLMHRDIKPENIMVLDSGHAKILDFGLARPAAPNVDQALTADAERGPGTPPYMSPEQVEGDELTCATDIFSFGTVLCELLIGTNPFRGQNAFATMQNVSAAELPSLREHVESTQLVRLVSSMLAKQAPSRPTANDIATTLTELDHQSKSAIMTGRTAATGSVTDTGNVELPTTRYAPCGDLHIAYQVFGSGPANLIVAPGFISNCDNSWANKELSYWLRRLGEFARVAVFDKRGTGLSDRVDSLPSMDERMEDLRTVMDAAGFETAAVLGISEGGSLASLFAATYPQRCSGLVLLGSFAKFKSWFKTREELEQLFDYIRSNWGTGTSLPMFAPTIADDPDFQIWWGKFERMGANPRSAIDLMEMNSQIDISPILPAIQARTLVIRRDDDVLIDPDAGDYLAKHIPNAKLVRSPGPDHLPWVSESVDAELDAIRELLLESTEVVLQDLVLATVVALHSHDGTQTQAIVETQINRFRGTQIHEYNDCLVTTFDGPARALHCARALLQSNPGSSIGVHTAEVTLHDSSVSGAGVNRAVEIASRASSGNVILTKTVKDLVAGSGFEFSDEGDDLFGLLPPED